ncbi:MAG: sigma-54-dependent Fis family transcriptional regulator [bacterium]|nr:sigma-54-dependent Fis family transcriptional regulator [bacterium]
MASLFSAADRSLAEAVSDLVYCNPFLPERVECERRILGDEFRDLGPIWHHAGTGTSPNVPPINQRVEPLAARACGRLEAGDEPSVQDLRLYHALAVYLLYSRFEADLFEAIKTEGKTPGRMASYGRFAADYERLVGCHPQVRALEGDPAHLFASFFQVRRAFHLIYAHLIGGSMPAARLRASVWESIFTRDMRRYRRSLYRRMGDVTTLVTGPSGTGKELVARAIGMARYIPFDGVSRCFKEDFEASFFPLNLSALSPTLIESELFGHRKGAFTGALQDRPGWLEVCPPLGTVFLDEIGEVELAIQVKLLRVLESRVFQRLGETQDRAFEGKIITATNRDLAAEMQAGHLREDFYYRLCSDLVTTPSLAEQLSDSPGELPNLIRFVAARIAGEEEADDLTDEVEAWIVDGLGPDYPWPGNFRELEQCVRNVMIRGAYRPQPRTDGPEQAVTEAVTAGRLSADELLSRYATLVYHRAGSLQEAGRRLGLDRRTVKARLDRDLLCRLRGEGDRH